MDDGQIFAPPTGNRRLAMLLDGDLDILTAAQLVELQIGLIRELRRVNAAWIERNRTLMPRAAEADNPEAARREFNDAIAWAGQFNAKLSVELEHIRTLITAIDTSAYTESKRAEVARLRKVLDQEPAA